MNAKESAVRGRSGLDERSDAGEKLADFRRGAHHGTSSESHKGQWCAQIHWLDNISISRPYKRKEDREIQDVGLDSSRCRLRIICIQYLS